MEGAEAGRLRRTKYFLTSPFRRAGGCVARSGERKGVAPSPDLTFKVNLSYRLYSSGD